VGKAVTPTRLTVIQGDAPWVVGAEVEMLSVLTPEQLRVFHAVQALYATHKPLGCTIREVALAAGIRGLGHPTHDIIVELVTLGYLSHEPGKPRTLVPRVR
jgi:hypothetical protein